MRIGKYGLGWQSEAATPLFAWPCCIRKRRGASLPAALQNRAFTLVELILVLALLVVITSLVAPAMSNFIRGRALDSEARRLCRADARGPEPRGFGRHADDALGGRKKRRLRARSGNAPAGRRSKGGRICRVDENVQISVLNAGTTGLTTFHESAGHPFFGGRHN